jgi:hypothetical protein
MQKCIRRSKWKKRKIAIVGLTTHKAAENLAHG